MKTHDCSQDWPFNPGVIGSIPIRPTTVFLRMKVFSAGIMAERLA